MVEVTTCLQSKTQSVSKHVSFASIFDIFKNRTGLDFSTVILDVSMYVSLKYFRARTASFSVLKPTKANRRDVPSLRGYQDA